MASAIKCHECNAQVGFVDNFCLSCGNQLDKVTNILKYYFYHGYEYNTIIDFITKYDGISMSLRSLQNRFKQLGLRRKHVDFDENEVRAQIQHEINGPGCMGSIRRLYGTKR